MLGFVESVDFVDEEECAFVVKLSGCFCGFDAVFDVTDFSGDCVEGYVVGVGFLRNESGEAGFSAAWRSP